MIIADALVPLASVLLGAGITYWLNVHDRRRNRVEELFARAIGAVAAAEASLNYMIGIAPPANMTAEDYRAMLSHIAREATLRHVAATAAARELVAEASAYRPSLEGYVNAEPHLFYRDTAPLIAELRAGATER